MNEDEPDYSDEIVQRLEEFAFTTDLFPLAPIESIARPAYEDLLRLRDHFDTDEGLNDQMSDVRLRIWLNHMFVMRNIAPIVTPLMKRTDPQGVYFGRKKRWGYEFFEDEKLEAGGRIEFIFEPNESLNLIETEQLQANWDASERIIRKRLRSFSNMTYSQILDHFIIFTEEYVEPEDRALALYPNDPPIPSSE